MKPHKHAELIKAWADGTEIEFRFKDAIQGWSDWKPNDGRFSNDPWWEYRIKPQPKPDVVREYVAFPDAIANVRDLTAALRNNLKLTFDGETGKLKSAEVL